LDLREYEQAKFELAALLRSAEAVDRETGRAQESRIRELFSRLAEDRFNLVVVGRFSRGKSSLMNAVLGMDRLPTGIRPLTSVITTVTYGNPEKAVLHFGGFSLPEDIPIAALSEYVTEKGNPGNQRRIRIAEIQLPAELLRRGFYFIDTPGLGSPIIENTRTTRRFLPEADAFVLVTSYEGPLSEEELRFLREATQTRHRIFIVINKHDMVSAEDRKEAMDYLREQISAVIGGSNAAVFSVSARDGLAAQLAHNSGLLTNSGLPEFETELLSFLINDKSREFLIRICDRIASVIRDLRQQSEARRLGERLNALLRRIDEKARTVAEATWTPSATPALQPARSCDICAEVSHQCFDFICKYQYEITINPDTQRDLADRGGLCNFHTWYYEMISSPAAASIGFAAVLDRWAVRLQKAVDAPACSASIPISGSCVLCDVRAAAEAATINALAAQIRQNPDDTLRSLSDLCIPHFRLLAAAIKGPAIAARLFAHQGAVLRRVAEDMRRFALKHQGLRSCLASEEEIKAAERALRLLAGHRSLNTPPPTLK
jgi:GTP-binding protein EngB required for normal cell division